jgi:hypothetical protein
MRSSMIGEACFPNLGGAKNSVLEMLSADCKLATHWRPGIDPDLSGARPRWRNAAGIVPSIGRP